MLFVFVLETETPCFIWYFPPSLIVYPLDFFLILGSQNVIVYTLCV